MPQVLLVEDDDGTATLVGTFLRREGFEVAHTGDGRLALAEFERVNPDLVVLDWGLPGLDGLGVCKALRQRWSGPILMLTARADDIDEVLALELGVDDFVAKPVRPRVLVAHLRALLRRGAPSDPDRLSLGELVVDRSRREVRVADQPVALTTAEFDLLWALAGHAGAPVEREALFRSLRGIAWDGLDRAMDMRVSQLRRKLREARPAWEDPIRTVRGVGYQLVRP